MGAIVFLLLICRMFLPWGTPEYWPDTDELPLLSYFMDFIVVTLNSVTLAFYLRYVGGISISFYIMFKVGLISLAPMIIVRISEAFRELKSQNESLIDQQVVSQKMLEKPEDELLSKSIEIISENQNENLNLLISDIAFIRSADNYVEVTKRSGDEFRKVLVRSTLKNIEQQLKIYPNFVRSHRTCIVNSHYIEKLNRSFNQNWLRLKGIEEKIPVSRQYLLLVKGIL